MSFLMITYDFPPKIGGVEIRAVNYISNLFKTGYKVIVVAPSQTSKSTSIEESFGATIYRCPASFTSAPKVFFSILKAIKSHPPIEILQILTGADSLLGMIFLIYSKIQKMKTGIFLYGKDILISKRKPIRRLFLQAAILIADKIGVNSKATSKLLPNFSLGKTHILYPGVNTEELSRYRIQVKPTKEKKILFVGRLIERKGADDLLRAFKLVVERNPNVKLIIVGDGPQKKSLTSLAEKLGVKNKVEFAGALRGRNLYEKYQECNVFIMPSKRLAGDVEGFGIVFLEAGFYGKPSIGTWSGGIPEAVIHNETGSTMKI